MASSLILYPYWEIDQIKNIEAKSMDNGKWGQGHSTRICVTYILKVRWQKSG